MLSVSGPPLCRARFIARSSPLILASYQAAFVVRSTPARANLNPVSTPPSPPSNGLFNTSIWSSIRACDTLPVVPSGEITCTQTGTVAAKFGSYARVVAPVSRLSSIPGSRDSPPRAVENPGAISRLRVLKLLTSAELHCHDAWKLVPAAVAGEAWNVAASAAAAKTASSDTRRTETPLIPSPSVLLLGEAQRTGPGRDFNIEPR